MCVYTSGQTLDPSNCHSGLYWKPYEGDRIFISYTNWAPDNPSCGRGRDWDQVCIQYWYNPGYLSFRFDDVDCDKPKCILCEYER